MKFNNEKGDFYCNKCTQYLHSTKFVPSHIVKKRKTCKACMQKHYKKNQSKASRILHNTRMYSRRKSMKPQWCLNDINMILEKLSEIEDNTTILIRPETEKRGGLFDITNYKIYLKKPLLEVSQMYKKQNDIVKTSGIIDQNIK
jgi:hypothetical protein